jgi:hypothetical protein
MAKNDRVLDRGACFEFAYNFHNLADGILTAANALNRVKTEGPQVALIGISSAIRSAQDLKKAAPAYRAEVKAIEKRLTKTQKEIHKATSQKPLKTKRREDLMYGLYKLHTESFKSLYGRGRKSCGLSPG